MATKTTYVGYTTYGSVRGGCGHLHRTVDSAEACLQKDQDGCAGQRGYSDRHICYVGPDNVLYRDADCTSWIPGEGGYSCGAATMKD